MLVVVDPLDDDGRGCFLSQLIMKFADLHGVAIVDRLDSFFEPVIDDATGDVVTLPRFPDALAQAAGPAAVDPASREQARLERLGRSREALTLLATLSLHQVLPRPGKQSVAEYVRGKKASSGGDGTSGSAGGDVSGDASRKRLRRTESQPQKENNAKRNVFFILLSDG